MARTKKAADPAPANEPEVTTNPVQEVQELPQEATTPQEVQEPAQEPEPQQEPPQDPADAPEDPAPANEPEGDPAPAPGDMPLPYKAKVAVALAVVRKAVGPGTAAQLKPVGTLKQGAAVTITNRFEGYAQLANGLWIDESFLAV